MLKLCAKKRKAYLVRVPDGYLFQSGQFHSFKSILKRRAYGGELASKRRKQSRAYYWNNLEKRKKYNKERWQRDKDISRGRWKIWYLKNTAKQLQKKKQYYLINKENIIEKQSEKNRKNRDKFLEKQKTYNERRFPNLIVTHAIADLRSNRITFDEFNRRVDEAIVRTDEIYNGLNYKRRKPV